MSAVTETPRHEGQGVPQMAERVAKAQKAYAESVSVGFERARQSYEQAQQAYAKETQALNAELRERSEQAYKAYAEALNAAYTSAPSYESYMAEYRSYVEQLQQLYSGNEALQRQKAAYEDYARQAASGNAEAATDAYLQQLKGIWSQQPLREQLEATQNRYLELLQRLAVEAQERQTQAWRCLLQGLSEIWSVPENNARAQGALGRLSGGLRDALVQCHETIQNGSSKAIEELAADGTS